MFAWTSFESETRLRRLAGAKATSLSYRETGSPSRSVSTISTVPPPMISREPPFSAVLMFIWK